MVTEGGPFVRHIGRFHDGPVNVGIFDHIRHLFLGSARINRHRYRPQRLNRQIGYDPLRPGFGHNRDPFPRTHAQAFQPFGRLADDIPQFPKCPVLPGLAIPITLGHMLGVAFNRAENQSHQIGVFHRESHLIFSLRNNFITQVLTVLILIDRQYRNKTNSHKTPDP